VTTKAKTAKKKAPAKKVKGADKTPARKKSARTSKRKTGVPSATAAAILGNVGAANSASGFVPVKDIQEIRRDWRKFYRNLLELRERLLEQVGGLARESAEQIDGYSLHMADCGTDNFDRDFALSLLSSDKDALSEIDAALCRIVEGTYGKCELTGKKIPRARLEAIPWTRYTVEAQAQIEREGGLRQRRLPTARTVGGATERTAVVADTEPGTGKSGE
jgi:RNA polymerase-binding transcription factor DksA